jgi:hypothetical protein
MGIEAEYDGVCGLCTEAIQPGQRIEQYEGEWCHEDCVEGEQIYG